MEDHGVGRNIRRLRVSKGLSQTELARSSRLSRMAVQKIEGGTTEPRVDSLMRIAESLDVDIADLFTEAPELTAVRFRSSKKLRVREDVLARVAAWLQNYNDLEALLDDKQEFKLAGLANRFGKKRTSERAIQAAVAARKALSLDSDEPIQDICGLLESSGVKVMSLAQASEGFFGLSVAGRSGGPAVVVNVWERITVERWIFSAAHEFGHLLLHMSSFKADQADEVAEEEKEANIFAAHFLMPNEAFLKQWGYSRGLSLLDSVLKIKRIFGVSYKTVLLRVGEQGRIDNRKLWPRFQYEHKMRYKKTLKAKDEPLKLSPNSYAAGLSESEPEGLREADFIPSRLHRLVRLAVKELRVTEREAAVILGVDLLAFRDLAQAW